MDIRTRVREAHLYCGETDVCMYAKCIPAQPVLGKKSKTFFNFTNIQLKLQPIYLRLVYEEMELPALQTLRQ